MFSRLFISWIIICLGRASNLKITIEENVFMHMFYFILATIVVGTRLSNAGERLVTSPTPQSLEHGKLGAASRSFEAKSGLLSHNPQQPPGLEFNLSFNHFHLTLELSDLKGCHW